MLGILGLADLMLCLALEIVFSSAYHYHLKKIQ